MYSKDEIKIAKKRVKSKKEFYQHLMSYLIVNFFLFMLNMITSPLDWWFHFPMLGWGIGLAFHYVDVFGVPGFDILSKEWENRALDHELRKMKNFDKPELEAGGKTSAETDEELKLKDYKKNYDESELV